VLPTQVIGFYGNVSRDGNAHCYAAASGGLFVATPVLGNTTWALASALFKISGDFEGLRLLQHFQERWETGRHEQPKCCAVGNPPWKDWNADTLF
jgi:hypothetical protein